MKQLVVEMNHGNAGFFVYLEYVIDAIHYCENTAEYYNLPSVDYGPITVNGKTNKFFDPNRGPNMFEYYFALNQKAPEGMFQDRRDVNFWCCIHEVVGVQSYPHGPYEAMKKSYDKPYTRDIDAWYGKNRLLANSIIRKHISIHQDVIEKVDAFWAQEASEYVLGVHIRGTDKTASIGGRKITPEEYFPYIDKIMERKPGKIFLATDDPTYFKIFKAKYPSLFHLEDILRHQNNIFLHTDEKNNYKKGLDVLMDCLCLSKCDFLLRGSSAVSEFAVYFNTKLHHHSLNLQYDCSKFLQSSRENRTDDVF